MADRFSHLSFPKIEEAEVDRFLELVGPITHEEDDARMRLDRRRDKPIMGGGLEPPLCGLDQRPAGLGFD